MTISIGETSQMSLNETSRITIDGSGVMRLIVASLTDDSRGTIYDCNMFIVQATVLIRAKWYNVKSCWSKCSPMILFPVLGVSAWWRGTQCIWRCQTPRCRRRFRRTFPPTRRRSPTTGRGRRPCWSKRSVDGKPEMWDLDVKNQWVETNPSNIRIFPTGICYLASWYYANFFCRC